MPQRRQANARVVLRVWRKTNGNLPLLARRRRGRRAVRRARVEMYPREKSNRRPCARKSIGSARQTERLQKVKNGDRFARAQFLCENSFARACSSVDRAPASGAGGRTFESCQAHPCLQYVEGRPRWPPSLSLRACSVPASIWHLAAEHRLIIAHQGIISLTPLESSERSPKLRLRYTNMPLGDSTPRVVKLPSKNKLRR